MSKTRGATASKATSTSTKPKLFPKSTRRQKVEKAMPARKTRPTRAARESYREKSSSGGEQDDEEPDTQQDDEKPTVYQPHYAEDIDVFSIPVVADGDFISRMPNELMHEVFSYCLSDHDADRAKRQADQDAAFVEKPHVLLSLAAMSRRFEGVVEDFSRRHLTKFKEHYYPFLPTRMLALPSQYRHEELRRSPRCHPNSSNSRVYRMDLVRGLLGFCIRCSGWTTRRATICNGVACCTGCEGIAFPGQILLTDALREYDLRDYMLIKSRQPGPRAKHTNLLAIHYGTVKSGMGWGMGQCVSYRFFRKDVQEIARLVHGDFKTHLAEKQWQQYARMRMRLKKVWQELKTEYHTTMMECAGDDNDEREAHQKLLERVQNADDWDWDDEFPETSGLRMDEYLYPREAHRRFCAIDPCEDCEEAKAHRYCCGYFF